MEKIMQAWIRSAVSLGLLGTAVFCGAEVPKAIAFPPHKILLSQFGQSAAQYMERGRAKMKQKDYQGAAEEATKAIQLNPNLATAYNLRQAARLFLKDYQGSISDGNRAIQLNPKYADSYFGRGQARLALQDFQGAIADATQALQVDTKPPALAYLLRANARAAVKDFQGAIADATKFIELRPASNPAAEAYNVRATAYFRLKDYQKLFADADQAVGLNPKSVNSFHNRGVGRLGLKDYQGALKDFEQAIAINPNNPRTFYYRGQARFKLGDNAGAISDYDQAVKLNPKFNSEVSLDNFNDPQLANYAALARSGTKAKTVAAGTPGTTPKVTTPTTTKVSSPPTTPPIAEPASTSQETVYQTASQFTVLIGGQNPGSGVIFAKTGNTYYVLTAKHVVATPDEYQVVTPDRKEHPINYSGVKKLPNVDLAVVQFTSNQSYSVARLGDSQQVKQGANVYVSGWPIPEQAITKSTNLITEGKVAGLQVGDADGYELMYGNSTAPGMSGGPVIDTSGRVIGIHGRAAGNQESGKVGINLGIPINLFLRLAPQVGLNLQQLGLRAGK
jgi:tetratricopeptide (TPR) repeat protein